ncbi:MAG TPA: hypothetical protein VJT67_09520 [Longimicrobiaceae bacterium]|nr:hypothetical protein [Longimicrobiaceae bacterium]
MRFALLLSLAATFAAVSAGAAQNAVRPAVHAKPLVEGSGTYKNVDYGFRVALPQGVVYERSPTPFPNHGFQVPVAAGDTLWVDASYTDSDLPSGVELELGRGCTLAADQPARLGGLPAREVVFRCPGGVEQREVLALRGTIAYTVGVRRVGGVSPSGAALFAAAREGFVVTPR